MELLKVDGADGGGWGKMVRPQREVSFMKNPAATSRATPRWWRWGGGGRGEGVVQQQDEENILN